MSSSLGCAILSLHLFPHLFPHLRNRELQPGQAEGEMGPGHRHSPADPGKVVRRKQRWLANLTGPSLLCN